MIYIVDKDNINKRLDIYLNLLLTKYTRSYIKKLIEDGTILVNDNIVKSGYSLKLNDKILVKEIEVKNCEVIPKKIDINIIYEDDDIIVINKKKGMVVHPRKWKLY